MKGEAFRELSRFDDALSLLDFEFPEAYEPMVNRVRDLCRARDTKVAKLA